MIKMGDIITGKRLADLKAAVKAEMLRRCYTDSVAIYGGSDYDYQIPAQTDKIISKEHYEKNAVPLNAVISNIPTDGSRIVSEAEVANFETQISTLKAIDVHATNTGCNTSCTGLCKGTCFDSCTGCGSGCASSCSGSCVGSCVGSCSAYCANSCDGDCWSCSGCSGSCTGSCTGSCSGCAGSCTGGCYGACTGTCRGCTGSCQGCTGTCTSYCNGVS